jgi:hypothetical protein
MSFYLPYYENNLEGFFKHLEYVQRFALVNEDRCLVFDYERIAAFINSNKKRISRITNPNRRKYYFDY